jgi:hypothetical protein
MRQLNRLTGAALLLACACAQAEVAVIVNPKNPAAKMTAEQVAQYFIGKSTALAPADYSETTPLRSEFFAKVLQKEPSQVKAIWTKLVFTGKGTAPKEFRSVAEMKKAVAADVNAIGFIDKAAADDSVKVVLSLP